MQNLHIACINLQACILHFQMKTEEGTHCNIRPSVYVIYIVYMNMKMNIYSIYIQYCVQLY